MESNTKTYSFRQLFLFLLIQIVISSFLFTVIQTNRNSTMILCSSTDNNLSKVHLGSSFQAENKESELIILLWAWPFGSQFPLDKCPEQYGISGCHFTANRTWYKHADAVILHHRDVCYSKKQLPQDPRPPNQYWIWFNLESPSHSPNLDFMSNLINLTMSYRRDSDIFTPYGWIQLLEKPRNYSIPSKSKMVAWAVSNWNPGSKRVKYYEELRKHIHIDVFGQGHMPLPREKHHEIISQYKFYLAFENSQHEDYITEKLWSNALLSGAVPIVLGTSRENYERFLPREAFIHIDDFPSAQEMAAYLLELDKNNERYQGYFDWQTWNQPVGKTSWITHVCKACQLLRQSPGYRTISRLDKWFK
ncbi:alpha-(1,3)-fucosyltransferase 6-like [Rhinatrema bivittatum]|uniref:alpha-(1,3)-fucosyltransferase 6-like n=1 Tax=Rhinatrema bivittatum TaxID=194408 RepID=UPI00112CD848|nr:alpha-(1,3)-fucosyltransferase 6-like [Rhinatrema bivittatum]XP_029438268.1 alpha-(1,3)-fucosyltransferase 6-like [Rhinatrema bivittatum]XP_029438269.1 alpha-(1,3)-fucosyltransferase 6-like [Rhinatrema bivittatum]XP_029438270.1 alpha-(1,3)-fucosyltransferase 6-like [Rhinatrema bivittatum]XP_029438271.1 alpha-(1,3)-fucosyltransferase 6-like [Rhinatrema bivittatum]XP_029438272.1 alpha-(1,3)-fucosyltransferase 6-like [Rhinatrema bivittatum]XP_029438273.1 alpha-(1,3)-fucosyltransferase 6-like 